MWLVWEAEAGAAVTCDLKGNTRLSGRVAVASPRTSAADSLSLALFSHTYYTIPYCHPSKSSRLRYTSSPLSHTLPHPYVCTHIHTHTHVHFHMHTHTDVHILIMATVY